MKTFVKSTPPSPLYFIKKTLLQNISLVVTLVTFSYVVMLHFSSLVLAGLQKCSLVLYTSKHGLAYNPVFHSGHLNFVLVCF